MYLLHGLAPFTAWLLAIVAIIMGIVKGPDFRGTYLESHVSWLARTFWFGLLWIALCGILTVALVIIIIGIPLVWVPWAVLFIWYLYRVIKGWLKLNDGQPVA
jgi:uncharacterized membrane protein